MELENMHQGHATSISCIALPPYSRSSPPIPHPKHHPWCSPFLPHLEIASTLHQKRSLLSGLDHIGLRHRHCSISRQGMAVAIPTVDETRGCGEKLSSPSCEHWHRLLKIFRIYPSTMGLGIGYMKLGNTWLDPLPACIQLHAWIQHRVPLVGEERDPVAIRPNKAQCTPNHWAILDYLRVCTDPRSMLGPSAPSASSMPRGVL